LGLGLGLGPDVRTTPPLKAAAITKKIATLKSGEKRNWSSEELGLGLGLGTRLALSRNLRLSLGLSCGR